MNDMSKQTRMEMAARYDEAVQIVAQIAIQLGIPDELATLERRLRGLSTFQEPDAKELARMRNLLYGWERWYVHSHGDGTAVLKDFADLLEPLPEEAPANAVVIANLALGLDDLEVRLIAYAHRDRVIVLEYAPERYDGKRPLQRIVDDLQGQRQYEELFARYRTGFLWRSYCHTYGELQARLAVVQSGIREELPPLSLGDRLVQALVHERDHDR